MFERFTNEARNVVTAAQQEARRLGHDCVGIEHVLLGLLQGEGIAVRALGDFGVAADAVEREVLAFVRLGLFGAADAEALGIIGIDLEEVRRRLEASFGFGVLRWRSGRRGGWRDPLPKN